MSRFITEEKKGELQTRGYTVVPDILTEKECSTYIGQYKQWLEKFDGKWPFSNHSLIQRYQSGHLEPSWNIRLKSKAVFDELWGTEKLVTSFDAIAIGRPPESGDEEFAKDGEHWLHCDQQQARSGLHAYQGGVYLEDATEEDWTLDVLEGSHMMHEECLGNNLKLMLRSNLNKICYIKGENLDWFLKKGCIRKRVPVPKGGMVLWDSRLIHANARPIRGRKNPGRWRYAVLVCMAPAAWSTREDIKLKQEAYRDVMMTGHWPADSVGLLNNYLPTYAPRIQEMTKVPKVATSKEARLLSAMDSYDFKDGRPNGPPKPKWHREQRKSYSNVGVSLVLAGAICVIAILYVFLRMT